jgi:hypothetical protein
MSRALSNKPLIRCPHCRERIEAERLLRHRKYRNKFGLDVFECPECRQRFKFEPTEYLRARAGLKGTIPSGVAIAGVKPDERLPSETIAPGQPGTHARWQKPLLVMTALAALLAGYLLFR